MNYTLDHPAGEVYKRGEEQPQLGFVLPNLSQQQDHQMVMNQLSLKSEEELGMLLDSYSGQFGGQLPQGDGQGEELTA